MPSELASEKIERRVVTALLAVAIVVSLIDQIWPFLGSRGFEPLVLLALLLIVRWLEDTRNRVQVIATGTPIYHYSTHKEFYEELSRAVTHARSRVYVYNERNGAPVNDIPEAADYYAACIAWASARPGERILQRMIRVPTADHDIAVWAAEQQAITQTVRNYQLRVREAPAIESEGRSFAVIDGQVVYSAFFLNMRGEVRCHSLNSEIVARDFEDFFRDVWNNA